ncbi:MAG: hypothetical protein WC906_04435 [Parcubacteria group bacterium]|jgi:hypothetical protein
MGGIFKTSCWDFLHLVLSARKETSIMIFGSDKCLDSEYLMKNVLPGIATRISGNVHLVILEGQKGDLSLKDIVRSFNLICCPAIVLIKGGKFRSMKFDPDNPEEILIREGGSVSA